ncbi:DNA repair-scaffolding protein-like [Gigantopelta aegis]|uniref:DNA repair-scaffolding protein-like n=1 Tax=Gigantopelta aegis TaxID=1735272 RepID=UPI001B88C0FF|nr:DNA repair-scaffolding protein-like [Gigantopelta aegis]
MSRLQNREKSSIRIWAHEQDETSSSPGNFSKVLFVHVQRFEVLFSLQLAHCLVMDGGSEETPVKVEKWRNALVLFSRQLMEQLQIQVGTVLRLYPPWQQLDGLHGEQSILLCTYYAKVISQPDGTGVNADNPTPKQTKQTWLEWNCPCLSDSHQDHKMCPAHEFPVMPSTLKYEKSTEESITGPTALHTITANEKAAPVISKSLLESIEVAGLHSLRHLCFKAVIHRIFSYHDNQTKRFSLLVEDYHGTVAVIAVPSYHGNEELWKLEGKSACFSGVLVDSRRNRNKDPGLFSVIDVVWSGLNTAETSQGSELSEKASSSHKPCRSHPPPGFCYYLKSDDDSFSFDTSPEVLSCYKKSELISLKEISQCDLLTRKSFLVRVIFQSEENENALLHSQSPKSSLPSKGRQLLYITDSSLQDETSAYLTIALSSNQSVDMKMTKNSTSLAFFKDILIEEGKCQIDGYSDIIDIQSERCTVIDLPKKTVEELRSLDIKLPEISNTCMEHSLVSVSGHIADVDDEASYSWEVCDQCQSDKLATTPHTHDLFCVKCQKTVSSPVTLLKMEVYVQTTQLASNCKLKVNLLQSTVKHLLPQSQEEEGYDISCILLENVGPLSCFIKTVTRSDDLLEIFAQEIKT